MTIKPNHHSTDMRRWQGIAAAGGLLGALAASSCCILPLALSGLGVSGASTGNFTRLAPYQPLFIATAMGFLGYGYRLVYRSSKLACADRGGCAHSLSSRNVRGGLILATILVVAALGLEVIAPLFFSS